MQTIEIQYRDGSDETIQGEDLAVRWDEITETPGIQYAGYRVPKRSGDGTRLYGHLGERREERAERLAARAAEIEEQNRTADARLAMTRDWTYNPYTGGHL